MRPSRCLSGAAIGGLLLVICGCGPSSDPSALPGEAAPVPAVQKSPVGQSVSVEVFARGLVGQIRDRQIEALGAAVHPELGLRFTPYATLSEQDVTLSAAELSAAWQDRRVLNWGHYDGTGEPIELSLRAYFEQFVYDADFATAPSAVNERLGHGNSISNLKQVYPQDDFVEFHRAGSEQYAGMDWSSLRLVLRPRPEGGWWLLALVHDQWTI